MDLLDPAIRPRALRRVPALGDAGTITAAAVLFVAISVLRWQDPNVGNAEGTLYVVPIALLALRFGLRGGLAGAVASLALTATWGHFQTRGLALGGYLSRGVALVTLGVFLGFVVDNRRRLEADARRYYEVALDLLVTTDFKGNIMRTNPAWQRTLGHSAETLRSRPLIEFVHPDDREALVAEMAVLASGAAPSVSLRSRWRAADNSYRWLQWSAHGSLVEGLVHASGRDITAQHLAEEQLAHGAKGLEAMVAERTRELEEAHTDTLQRLAVVAEYHDHETALHTRRVGTTAAELANCLGLGAEQVKLIDDAAPLHDVGKLGIPDRILLKPAKLTTKEYAVMRTHTALGERVLAGSNAPVLRMAAVIAASHHERWDGSGYPLGLAGEAIPLVGRIVAVADVFDALTHDRPYKPAWPVAHAVAEIQREAGSQFDPRVVAAFLVLHSHVTGVPTVAHPDSVGTRPRAVGLAGVS
jgi:PAS domain S-box-containing protein